MSKRQLLILLGIWNMLFLFISFPAAWDKVFALASGAIIITIALALKPKEKVTPKSAVPFVENKNTVNYATSEVDRSSSITSTDSRMNS